MPSLADLLYLGQPDPARQIALALSGQQPQPPQGGPQGAGPPGANPQPPNGPAPADPNAPNPNPGDPAPPNSAPQPQALQSTPQMNASYQTLANPPNLMNLYLQLQQRQAASDQINKGFALIAANHAGNPAMMRAIMDSAGGGGNASGMVGDLMNLYQGQQTMAAQSQLLAQAPALAQKLGMDEGTVRSMILAGRGPELVKSLEPTQEARDYQWKHDQFIKNGGTEEQWQRDYAPFLLSGGAGGGDATTRSWQTDRIMWNRDHPGEPYPWGDDNPSSYGLWKTQQGEMVKDQEDARNKLHSGYEQNITDLRGNLGSIIGLKPGGDPNNPADYDPAKQAILKSALSKPGAQAYLSGDPKAVVTQAQGVALTPEEKEVLDQIRDTTDKNQLFGTLNARAPKRGVSDVNSIGSGLTSMQNVRQGFDRYLNSVKTTITSADQALGNGYGAAGEAENAPDYTKPLINDAYLPGGSMYPFGKKPLPMSQDQIAQATQKIKAAQNPEQERQILIKVARANNIDTKPLQNLRY